MAKISFPGLKEYELKISRLGDAAEDIAGKVVYAGAKVIADEIRDNIGNLKAVDDRAGLIAWRQKTPPPLTETAKKGLLEGFGVSPIQNDNGYLNVKLGFDGYNDLKTERYPKGQPNVLIARVTESGTSTAIKQPFVRTALNAKKPEAERVMGEVADKEIEKIMKK